MNDNDPPPFSSPAERARLRAMAAAWRQAADEDRRGPPWWVGAAFIFLAVLSAGLLLKQCY
jgi:hypothetical protein